MKEGENHIFFQKLFLSFYLLSFPFISMCQCIGKAAIKTNIRSIENSVGVDDKKKLDELLYLQKEIWNCGFEKDSINMFLLQKIGKFYYKQADYNSAIIFTTASLKIAKQCNTGNTPNNLSVIDGYYNLQYYYNALNNLPLKYNAADSCIAYSLKSNNIGEKTIAVLLDKTNYLFNKGEYSLCVNDARLGLSILELYKGKYKQGYAISFIAPMIDALIFSEDITAAELLLTEQLKKFKAKNNAQHIGSIYSFLGTINKYKKNYQASFIYYKKANEAFTRINFKNGQAQSLTSIGMLYANNFNDPEKGLKFCNLALSYADGADSLFILTEMGNIYVLKKMYSEAHAYFKKAFNAIQASLDETNIVKSSFLFPGFNVLQKLLDLITIKGDALVKQYNQTKNDTYLNCGINVYQKAALFLTKIKLEQQLKSASNLIWRKMAHNLYEHAIEACFIKNDVANAFNFFEKSRATLLNDQLNEQLWMADQDITQQARLKKDILLYETSLNTLPPASNEFINVQKKLYVLRQNLDISLNNIKSKNPLFYSNYLDTSLISIEEVRKNILLHSKSLLEIFSGDSAIYILTITPLKKSLIKINKILYDSLTNKYINFLEDPFSLNNNFISFTKTASDLYHLIFQQNIPPPGSIIISPDGKNFPFESLITTNDAKQVKYFLYNYAISYTYSIKYLTNSFVDKSEATNILGFAPVNYATQSSLTNLTGSDSSLQNIKKSFSAISNYTYTNATRYNFMRNFANYKIIQLYTHSSENSFKNEPVIYFADSALYLSELILERKPITQLIILSACETANGILYKGEGIFSFNRGFAALGIPAAVSNLWAVDNKCNYAITELFYKFLKEGNATDIALQKAKLYFIKNSSSKEKTLPYFWASSILVGKVGVITEGDSIYKKIKITSIIVLLGICTFYFFSKRQRISINKILDYPINSNG